jgi:hypothetical protein
MKETLPRASSTEKAVSFSETLIVMKESSQTAGKKIFVSYYVQYIHCLLASPLTAVRVANHFKKSLRIISRCRCVCLS